MDPVQKDHRYVDGHLSGRLAERGLSFISRSLDVEKAMSDRFADQ